MAVAPLCTTSGPYIAIRILQGIFGAPVESLPEISLTDIWFTHERPRYLAWYGWSLAMAGKLAPMLSGFINAGMGWKWTLWWCAIFEAMAFIYCFLFMEETNYDRKHTISATSNTVVADQTPSESDVQTGDSKHPSSPQQTDFETGEVQWQRKTYVDKLSLKDKARPNQLLDHFIAPFKGFTYPAIVYAG